MPDPNEEVVRYKRNHFAARLPRGRLYSPAHYWLQEYRPGHWRVGLTPFATRMLGEIVEFDFEVEEGGEVAVGDALGWIEGFKAVSDVYGAAAGVFEGVNGAALESCEVICVDPFARGWLYSVQGSPDPRATDVAGYVELLDRTIDRMQETPWTPSDLQGP